ncbi:prephenate dehydratase [Pilimelia terevasa]|uniref:Prephenate dehydratase n=1 Tax=Pilimelia terevasa TaxID=53372 RepID=A0A8J3BMY9_9ACTN|nr:prephenate dehydratase [Pilimelia terevasa]GGK32954.1 prephenate dehydratase [Pilimelia terevasa]
MPGVPPTRFVFLGPEGTFAEQALRAVPAAARGTRTPAASVPDALDAVRAGEADAALVPLENSVGGAVGVTMDELAAGDPLMIIREVVLPVNFVLATRADADAPAAAGALRTVAAHPQAAAQCRGWLRAHAPAATVVEALSNAAAAAAAANQEVDAAVCAPLGLRRYRLRALAEQIADRADAQTRFVLVGRPAPPPPPSGDDVTTVAVRLGRDRVGGLLGVLTELAVRGISLTRIESRPTGDGLGSYVFLVDCAGHVAEPPLGEALMGLRRVCFDVRFLGSYPRHRLAARADRPHTPAGLAEVDFADAAAWLAALRAGRPG